METKNQSTTYTGADAIAFLAPLGVFMILGTPTIWGFIESLGLVGGDGSPSRVLATVIVRDVLIFMVVAWFAKPILRSFPLRISLTGAIIGVLGGVLWIGLCRFHPEGFLLQLLGVSTDYLAIREGVNPWELYESSITRGVFLVFRFTLLVLAVPIAEELAIRGFLARSVESDTWETLKLSDVRWRGFAAVTAYAVLTHPSEAIAAILWFGMVSLMMIRTGRFWDCVLAHAITNAMLGIYVCVMADWRWW
ncbi:MAG: CPBP family glutamic-type intramembrane protease [Planctomycetota bacterium]